MAMYGMTACPTVFDISKKGSLPLQKLAGGWRYSTGAANQFVFPVSSVDRQSPWSQCDHVYFDCVFVWQLYFDWQHSHVFANPLAHDWQHVCFFAQKWTHQLDPHDLVSLIMYRANLVRPIRSVPSFCWFYQFYHVRSRFWIDLYSMVELIHRAPSSNHSNRGLWGSTSGCRWASRGLWPKLGHGGNWEPVIVLVIGHPKYGVPKDQEMAGELGDWRIRTCDISQQFLFGSFWRMKCEFAWNCWFKLSCMIWELCGWVSGHITYTWPGDIWKQSKSSRPLQHSRKDSRGKQLEPQIFGALFTEAEPTP